MSLLDEVDPLPPPDRPLLAERRDETEPGRSTEALIAGPGADDRAAAGARKPGDKTPRRGAVISAVFHLAIVAALLWLLPIFQAKPPEIAIPASVTFIAVGEGEGKVAAREGQHAAEPDATPITAPPVTNAPSPERAEAPVETKGEPAQSTADVPPQPQQAAGEVAEQQPPSAPAPSQPAEAQAAPSASAEATPAPAPTPAPSDAAPAPAAEAPPQSPQIAALPPPETTQAAPAPPPVEAPHAEPLPQPAPTPPAPPAAPSAAAKRPSPARPRAPPKRPDDSKAPAPEAPPKIQAEPQIAVTPEAPPDAPKLPPAPKFLATLPQGTGETHLPPASTVNPESPTLPQSGGAPRLPAASSFKPGSPGDVQRPQRGPTGEVGGTKLALQSGGAKGFGKEHGTLIQEISELQSRIDRLLLVYSPDHPDVVALQREVDELFAQQGPLTEEELAPARRQLAECWARGAASLGLPNQDLGLSLVLDRDGAVREATIADPVIGDAVAAKRVLDMVRGCGALTLPPERYLVWQKLTLRVGAR
jgi:hypothetical protein